MTANPLTREFGVELDRFGRAPVDEFMKVKGVSNVFAAGDVAWASIDDAHVSVMSCQHGRPMGRFAGHNVICDLLGLPVLPLRIEWYVTVLDLGPWGAAYTQGWDRAVASIGEEPSERSKRSTAKGFIRHSPRIEEQSSQRLLRLSRSPQHFIISPTPRRVCGERLRVDFVNTEIVEGGDRLDLLPGFDDLVAWCNSQLPNLWHAMRVSRLSLGNRQGGPIGFLFSNSEDSFDYVSCQREPVCLANYVLQMACVFPINRVVQDLA
jgi:hypothetical protein